MEVIQTELEGVKIIEPRVFKDNRGYFFESFNKKEFVAKVGNVDFVQDNESCSEGGVIRGLHFQKPPHAQAKLVRCVRGAVLDVVVDIRKGSHTFGEYIAVELSESNHRQLYIPRGFAHGFAVLSEMAVFQYKCDNYYHPESEGGIFMFDPAIAIDWKLDVRNVNISEKDRKHPLLEEIESPFFY